MRLTGGNTCAGTLVLWAIVVFLLMLCTFGIGAASGKFCADSVTHLHATSSIDLLGTRVCKTQAGHCNDLQR